MRRKSLILGTCLCLALSLAACGTKKSNGTDDTKVTGEATPGVTEGATEEATPGVTGEAEKSNVTVALGQYKGIEVTVEPVEVTEEEVQSSVDSFNNAYGVAIPVKDKTVVESGDTVNIDYTGKMDGKEFSGGSDTDATLTIGSNSFIPGFEDGLIGKKVGETVDVNVTFPENYGSKDLAGKDAVFTVKINFLDSGKKEPITDEVIAKNDQNGNKTVEEYKEYIRKNLKSSKEANAESQKNIDIMKAAIANATFTGLEQSEIDELTKYMSSNYEQAASQYGLDLETYVKYMFSGMSMDEFNAELTKAADFNVHQKYLLQQIVDNEKLTLSDEEYNTAVTNYMSDYGYKEEEKDQFITDMGGKELIEQSALLDKAKALVLDSAVVVEK